MTDKKTDIKHDDLIEALSNLETEIIAIEDIAEIIQTLGHAPNFLAWCITERAEFLRKHYNQAWKSYQK